MCRMSQRCKATTCNLCVKYTENGRKKCRFFSDFRRETTRNGSHCSGSRRWAEFIALFCSDLEKVLKRAVNRQGSPPAPETNWKRSGGGPGPAGAPFGALRSPAAQTCRRRTPPATGRGCGSDPGSLDREKACRPAGVRVRRVSRQGR